ncbi:MAG: ATP-binding protein [Acidobacteriia bacterium]|nr:ATP-binding protein [Terriglobia bacterium]
MRSPTIPAGVHKRIRTVVGGVVLVLSASLLFASAADRPLVAYAERTWQMQDGLPEQIVQAFAQTRDRYLWIGTTGGLLRFDGARFSLYNRENTPAFSDNNIFCLMVSQDNTLWIGTEGGGLIQYRDGAFRAFSSKDGLTNSFVRSVYQDSAGRIWVGTDNGLFQFRGERVERVDDSATVPLLAVHAIYEDRGGGLWVGGSRLVRLKENSVVEYHLEGEASQNRVKSLLETADGAIWVGTVSGLHRKVFAQGVTSRFEKVHEVGGTVRFLRQTSEGALWIGTIGHGLYVYRDGVFSKMTAPERLPSNTVLNLFEDVEQNIWVGTQAGMLRLSNTPVRTVALPDASDSDAETVYEDRGGDVWVAAADLFRYRDGKATQYRFPGISGVRIRNVFRDQEGALWAGTEGRGVYRQVGERLFHYTTKEGLVNNFIRAFLASRDGSVWIATDEGVSRWRTGTFTNFQISDGLCYFSTRSLLEDRNGDLWIGTDRGVSRLHNERFQNDVVTAALQHEKVWAIHQDSDGGLWFGTRAGGLYRWRDGTLSHYTTAQGLASNSIYELVEDQRGRLWISGPNGISAVSRHDLDAVAEQRARRVNLTLYGISEGLETIQMCGGEKPAGLLTTRGEVWFPSSKGPVRMRVDQPKPSEQAPAVIDQVVADGLQISPAGGVSLGPDTKKLELHYGVVLLRSQERVEFRYRLDEFDKDWSDASADRVAYYTNLPAGRYRFRVAAFEMNNPEQIAEASLEIVQRPHFYRTMWFLSCCILALAGAAWTVHEFRLRQLGARFQAVLGERNRLAREMHDTLIQGCASVSALLEAHSSLGPTEADAQQDLLNCARTQLRTTINEAREAVWNLRQKSPPAEDLGTLLRRMTEQVSQEFAVNVECHVSGKPFDFEQATIHELLMVVREAIYNAVRHGRSSKVQVEVQFDADRCDVKIRDDGAGFDPQSVSSLPAGHYGLVGMKERITRVGGELTLNSRPGGGAEVTFHIPRGPFVPSDDIEVMR